MTNQELLVKVKQNLSIDYDEQDSYILALIQAVKDIATEKTGIDFEVEQMNDAVANSIVENVSKKFDDGGFIMDLTIFQMFNSSPMFLDDEA